MRKALSVIIFLLVVFGASAQRWQKVGQGSLNFPNGEPSMLEGKKVADINNGETEIDLSTERPGIYILIVYNVAGQRSYVKLIKD